MQYFGLYLIYLDVYLLEPHDCLIDHGFLVWQAFEPPLDLSQDINIDESEPLSDVSDNQPCVGEKTDGFCEHDKKSAIVSGTQTEGQNSGTTICRSSKVISMNELSLAFFPLRWVCSLLFILLPSLSYFFHFHYEV